MDDHTNNVQAAASTEPSATPYEDQFVTELHQTLTYKGCKCGELRYCGIAACEFARSTSMFWGRIRFDLQFQRAKSTEEKNLQLNVTCNKGVADPHWSCSFLTTIEFCANNESTIVQETKKADRRDNSIVIPLMRRPEIVNCIPPALFKVTIKVTSWSGTYPKMVNSFDEKTDISDATLVVEGRKLFVSRAILALHSNFFHNIFFNNDYVDHKKSEYELTNDISYDEMKTVLELIYANSDEEKPLIDSKDTIERTLQHADYFGCKSITRHMEKYLMGEMKGYIEGFTLSRRLLLSDRFRLSAPYNLLISQFRTDTEMTALADTPEYAELSESLKSALLDQRFQSPTSEQSRKRPAPGAAQPPTMNWASFSVDIDRLATVVAGWPQSLQERRILSQLQPALLHLQSLRQTDYDAITSNDRDEIHAHMIDIIDDMQDRNYSTRNVMKLVSAMWTEFPELERSMAAARAAKASAHGVPSGSH